MTTQEFFELTGETPEDMGVDLEEWHHPEALQARAEAIYDSLREDGLINNGSYNDKED